jgi:hypothetical protein
LNLEIRDNDKNEKRFIDPATATSVLFFVLKNIVGGIISFLTFGMIKRWRKKSVESDIDSEENN